MPETYDLVVHSHLRWDGVFQRPHHIISRLSKQRRVVFIEEPLFLESETAVGSGQWAVGREVKDSESELPTAHYPLPTALLGLVVALPQEARAVSRAIQCSTSERTSDPQPWASACAGTYITATVKSQLAG